jgi:hypothetical protein
MEGMMSKWQIGPVKLANGEEAFVDAINEGQEECHYTGRIRNPSNVGRHWVSAAWHLNGRYAGDMFLESNDLLNLAPPPKKTVRVQAWLMIWPTGVVTVLYNETEAMIHAKKHGFALIPIDREVTEGEGLS